MTNERVITLQENPVDLFGPNNIFYNQIITNFPKLKVTSRGNELRIKGAEADINEFEIKLESLSVYLERYGSINQTTIDSIYSGKESSGPILDQGIILYGNNGRIVRAKTHSQQKLLSLYDKNDLFFAVGPAGTGKTYTAIALAVRALKNKEVKRIILTRPAVEAGERLGFLPGDMKEKLDPYLQPLYDALHDMIPARKLETYMEEGTVQIAPLAYMRGRTLDHAFVILDEAQNTTFSQLKMFLTRMGSHAKFIVTGDMSQVDLPRKLDSGLQHVLNLLKNIKGIAQIEFDENDVLRHPLVREIIMAFDCGQKE